MPAAALPRLSARGLAIDTSPEKFGRLRSSIELVDDVEALRGRMREDGYLYLPGLLDRELAKDARKVITSRLAAEGMLHPDHPAGEAFARPGVRLMFRPDLALDNSALA